MFKKSFWKGATERAIKTFAQTAVAVLTADSVVGLLDVNAVELVSVAGLAAIVSVLTSVANPDFVAGHVADEA
jgi:hypothetical protein